MEMYVFKQKHKKRESVDIHLYYQLEKFYIQFFFKKVIKKFLSISFCLLCVFHYYYYFFKLRIPNFFDFFLS